MGSDSTHRHVSSLRFALLGGSLFLAMMTSGLACPFCAPTTTLSERISESHQALGVTWISGKPADNQRNLPGETRLKVTHVFRESGGEYPVGTNITLPQFHAGQKGDLFLLFGSLRDGEILRWESPEPVTLELFDYLASRPDAELPAVKRLPYYLNYLEHANETIAVDAYSEFANADYKDVKRLKDQFPRRKLHRWIVEPAPGTGRIARIAFYGMLLGLCGKAEDAKMLEQQIVRPVAEDDLRIGVDGLMAGYLLLTKERGLDVITRHAFGDPFIVSEAFHAQQAIRFLWEYGDGCIAKPRLRRALHPLLQRPFLAEVVILDLARWKDTTIVDRLIEIYTDQEYDLNVRLAIVRYYLEMSREPEAGQPEIGRAVREKAKRYLKSIERDNPRLVAKARKFL